jgi:hypothetical protein
MAGTRKGCIGCGKPVRSKVVEGKPRHCRSCRDAARAAERERSEQLERFRAAFPDASFVGVEKSESGLFVLAFRWAPDPEFYEATDGWGSCLPSDGDGRPIPNGGWAVVVRAGDTEDALDTILRATIGGQPFWADNRWWSQYPRHGLADEQVIDAIREDRRQRGREVDWAAFEQDFRAFVARPSD